MAANFDYVFIITSLNNNFSSNRITRYVTAALQGNSKPVVILTKADLCADKEKYIKQVKAISKELDVFAISSVTKEGLEQLKPYLRKGTTIVLLGSSGVGKSTLVNTIAGKEIMKVREIRKKYDRGRHTTTHRQLITLDCGVMIIDTPGMRELGICDVEEGLDQTFSDVKQLIDSCKFHNCRHQTEPGCAIMQALSDGSLSQERWQLYLNL